MKQPHEMSDREINLDFDIDKHGYFIFNRKQKYPFVTNPRGVYTHIVKRTESCKNNSSRWLWVKYLCTGSACSSNENKLRFSKTPINEVCSFCEDKNNG